jgi:hypothetical protein
LNSALQFEHSNIYQGNIWQPQRGWVMLTSLASANIYVSYYSNSPSSNYNLRSEIIETLAAFFAICTSSGGCMLFWNYRPNFEIKEPTLCQNHLQSWRHTISPALRATFAKTPNPWILDFPVKIINHTCDMQNHLA